MEERAVKRLEQGHREARSRARISALRSGVPAAYGAAQGAHRSDEPGGGGRGPRSGPLPPGGRAAALARPGGARASRRGAGGEPPPRGRRGRAWAAGGAAAAAGAAPRVGGCVRLGSASQQLPAGREAGGRRPRRADGSVPAPLGVCGRRRGR